MSWFSSVASKFACLEEAPDAFAEGQNVLDSIVKVSGSESSASGLSAVRTGRGIVASWHRVHHRAPLLVRPHRRFTA
jgi:hypothetical protein